MTKLHSNLVINLMDFHLFHAKRKMMSINCDKI